jgi:hypothetical protein
LGEENKFWLWPNNEHVGTLEEIQFREGVALKRKKWDAEKQSKGKEENAAK